MADLIERLRAKRGMAICPYDQRSPDYYTTNDTDPCKFCGTKNEEGAPDLCKGVDMRVMDEAASEVESLTAQVAVMGEALEPFDDFADNVDDVGWASDVHKERISYWFGPSDFRKARRAARAARAAAKEPS